MFLLELLKHFWSETNLQQATHHTFQDYTTQQFNDIKLFLKIPMHKLFTLSINFFETSSLPIHLLAEFEKRRREQFLVPSPIKGLLCSVKQTLSFFGHFYLSRRERKRITNKRKPRKKKGKTFLFSERMAKKKRGNLIWF